MKSIYYTLLVTFLIASQVMFAQDTILVKNPPIIIEPMMSDRGFYIQSITNKKFQTLPKLGFFNASGILNEWNSNKAFEVMTQSYLIYSVNKKISLNTGFHYSNVTGMRPTIGIMYTYAYSDWFATIFPRIDISKEQNIETFGLIEYKPKINTKINFYARLQMTFIQNFKKKHHERSYMYLRSGINYKEFTLGPACNIDYYGESKANKNSYGLFIMFQLY